MKKPCSGALYSPKELCDMLTNDADECHRPSVIKHATPPMMIDLQHPPLFFQAQPTLNNQQTEEIEESLPLLFKIIDSIVFFPQRNR